jgi:DNA-binding transcriptional LysR family regulator
MDINTIEAFLALADNLNFTKSAEHLYISQPAFSRKITRLEDEFGVKLFARNKRTVELTQYGKAFYVHAQEIFSSYAKWTVELRQLRSHKQGKLRIGYLQDLPHRLFPKTVRKFQRDYDQIELSFTDCSMTDITNRLLANEIDIGFSLLGDVTASDKITYVSLLAIPFCVALPEDHPLAGEEALSVSSLANEPFIVNDLDGYGPGTRQVMGMCSRAGFEPRVAAFTSFVPSMLILVKAGVGCTIVVDTARQIAPDGVRMILLDPREACPTELMLLWKTSNDNPAIPAFVATCQSLVAEVLEEQGEDAHAMPPLQ